jgi:hypothetical protein
MDQNSSTKVHIVSNVKTSVSGGTDMIALANGYSKVSYFYLSMGNTSPFAVSSSQWLGDQVNNMVNNELRGLHI